MAIIQLKTEINADIEICFDLSRSIDLHQISTADTNEKAIAGKTKGLINLGEFVTWQARHFGVTQKLTSKISAFKRPYYFRDEQQKGIFKYFVHDHIFETEHGIVIMKDIFNFESPFGYFGKFFDKIALTKYLTKLLTKRNSIIKEYAETGKWKAVSNDEV